MSEFIYSFGKLDDSGFSDGYGIVCRRFYFLLVIRIAIFNTSEQSSAFNHEYGSCASEPKARTPTVRVIKCTFAHAC
jgi:hypothetical protein